VVVGEKVGVEDTVGWVSDKSVGAEGEGGRWDESWGRTMKAARKMP